MTQVELHAQSESTLAEKVNSYTKDHPGCNFKIYYCTSRKLWRASAVRI